MKKALHWLNVHMEEVILVLGTAVMIILIFLQVVMRYVFKHPLSWSEELARYIFVWQVWLAVPYTVTRGRHIQLKILPDLVGDRAKFVLDMLFYLVSAAFFGYVGLKGIKVVQGIMKMHQLLPAMQIPKWICYLALPVGSLLGAFRFLQYGHLRVQRYMKDPADRELFVPVGDPDES